MFLPPPLYPREAAVRGLEGEFDLVVKVAPDGSATLESMEVLGKNPSRDRRRDKIFEPELAQWIASLRFEPEQLDGVPVATRISIVADFKLVGEYVHSPRLAKERAGQKRGSRAEASRECLAASREDGSPVPVVLDSPFKPLGAG